MTARRLIPLFSLGLLSFVGCTTVTSSDVATGDAPAGDPERGQVGKADLTGSCRDACGGKSKSAWCYCDDLCESFGDCCHDYAAECGADSCPEGLLDCDGMCIDAQADAVFCGASADCQGGNAGLSCEAEEACVSGHCRGWLGDQLIQDEVLADAGSPRLAVNDSGNVVAIWSQNDGQVGQTWFNRYDAETQRWGTPTQIGAELDSTTSSGIALAPDSSAMLLLSSREASLNGQRWVNRAARYDWASDTWTDLEEIQSEEGSAIFGSIVADDDGNATATWSENIAVPRRHDRWANRFDAAAGTWGEAQRIEADDTAEAYDRGTLVADADGNVTTLWNSLAPDGHRDIWANRYSAESGRWDEAQLVESDAESAWHPEAAVDSHGNVVAVWSMQDLPAQVLATRYDASAGRWQGVSVINLEGELRAAIPNVAVDPEGNAVVVWYQHDGERWNVWFNRYDAAAADWSTPQLIEDTDRPAERPRVGVDQYGNATFAWLEYDGISTLHTRRFSPATGVLGPRQRLHTEDEYVERFELVVNPQGVGAVVMIQRANDRWTARANRYE